MIAIDHVSKSFGATRALVDCALTVEAGAFQVLIGPSGCGKSTLLRAINGLVAVDAGTIRLRGVDITTIAPEVLRRGIGYVIQGVGLFPHWTVADNIRAVPRLLGWDKARIARRLDAIVGLLRIDPALLARYPHQLSGGQRQRIGIARALAAEPAVILMDEPFSALDPVSRLELRAEMRAIQAIGQTTIVMVTHDVGEALSLATSLAVMRAGRIVQVGAPAEVLAAPADDDVARFLGGDERFAYMLDIARVGDAMRRGAVDEDAPRIAASASLRAALSVMMGQGHARLAVADEAGTIVGVLPIEAIVTVVRHV